MKKKQIYITLILLLLYFSTIRAFQLDSIVHNRKVLDYHQRNGSIKRYEDRLFINTYYSLEEVKIHNDGSLERISFIETGYCGLYVSLIDEERLYSFYQSNERHHIMIFDLTTVPMTHLTTVEIPFQIIRPYMVPQIMGDYILISNNRQFIGKFNKRTLQFEDRINLPAGIFVVKDTVFISAWWRNDESGNYDDTFLWFHHYEDLAGIEPWRNYFLEITLDLEYHIDILSMKLVENYLYIHCVHYFAIYDISDYDNIHKIVSIRDDDILYFTDVLFYENFMLVSHDQGLRIYDISDIKTPLLIHEDLFNLSLARFPTHIYEDKLFVNTRNFILTIDLVNNFERIARHGGDIHHVTMRQDYVIEHLRDFSEIKIYSLLDDDPEIIILQTGFEPTEYIVRDFEIVGDNIYIVAHVNVFTSYLDIYSLSNQDVLFRKLLDEGNSLRVFNDLIIITQPRGGLVGYQHIYKFVDNDLSYIGMIVGDIGRRTGYRHDDYFITREGNAISFHSNLDPFDVLYKETNSAFSIRIVSEINDNLIGFSENLPGIVNIFQYEDDFSDFWRTSYLSIRDKNAVFYNGYMTINAWDMNTLSEFYSIENGIPIKIGELDVLKNVSHSYIFPEEKKLITYGLTSIHVYDIEFTASENDPLDTPILSSELYSNFPNPFNPETTIRFFIIESGDVVLDVYNIRGQRVRRLLEEYKDRGEYSVVWDGLDESGRELSSGVYLYRMETGGEKFVGRMVLLK